MKSCKRLIYWITLLALLCMSKSLVKIEHANEIVQWDECILRKVVIHPNEDDPCYRCSMNPKQGTVVTKSGWNQKYINCSMFCDHVTVCTESKYYTIVQKEPILIPVCYQCENRKTEEVHFISLGADKICSTSCVECAYLHDIMTASECSKKCQGLPTFCYPIEFEFKQRKCYVATHWFGCKFQVPTNSSSLSQKCKDCAIQATNEVLAQECSVDCDGLPTYRRDPKGLPSNSTTDNSILQCMERPLAIPGEFLYYDIPTYLTRHMQAANPGNLYPVAFLTAGSTYFSGSMGKFIFRKFNMSLMTWPRPEGYQNIRI